MFLKKIFKFPFVILVIAVLVYMFGDLIPMTAKQIIYSISLTIKDIIVIVLPLLIFSFVLFGMANFDNESPKIILLLIGLVCISNFCGFWVSYIITAPILKNNLITISTIQAQEKLQPGFSTGFLHMFMIKNANMYALIAGITIGLACLVCKKNIRPLSEKLNHYANFILKKIILPLLPILISGFIIQMHHEKTLTAIAMEYGKLLIYISTLTYCYMFIMLFILSGFNIRSMISKFRNLLPGISIGFFSMSSAAAIPSTIDAVQKNIKNENIGRFVVPASANMHLLGDCFVLPVIALALMVSFGKEIPSISQYLTFSLMGVMAKFSAAGIPGGSAIILQPILAGVFGFDKEMCGAVLTIYMLFDSVATSANVFGHGIFAEFFNSVLSFIKRGKSK